MEQTMKSENPMFFMFGGMTLKHYPLPSLL